MASTPEFALERLLQSLTQAEIDFVVVGGVAVVVQSSPRFTRDLDICYATDQANLDKLGELLTALGARLRGAEEDVPFVPDGRTLKHTQMLTLTTRDGDIDLLTDPAGSPGYAALKRKASHIDLNGCTALIASVDDLIAMKSAAGRPQDLVDLESLRVARRRARNQPGP
ncbi:MAG TPA: nucleotidyl transferase AbiEii/AbiGii toxin family protein [Solirubrobacteraceae bacterium]|nr:nucleotidyl transferase AbiEii/AbiGii toxin family protein [Solirubrobacteraceae bacterium]